MRYQAFQPNRYVTSFHDEPEEHVLRRCRNQLVYNILPTLLILFCFALITLYLSSLIDQAKLRTSAFKAAQVSPAEASQEPDASLPDLISFRG